MRDDLLKRIFNYNPDTGIIKKAGVEINGRSNGYIVASALGRRYPAGKLAWFLHNGTWPENYIDHINGVRDDNRICNLRNVTPSINAKNRKLARNNSSGIMNISKCKKSKSFIVQITSNGKKINRRFCDVKSAIEFRDAMWKENGFHINHGRNT